MESTKVSRRMGALSFCKIGPLALTAALLGACWPTRAGDRVSGREGPGMLLERQGQRVLLLSGTPFEMGYQHGKLLAQDVKVLVGRLLLVALVADREKKKDLFAGTIERAWKALAPHIPARYREEMRGLAAGSGVPIHQIELANVFPELFHCSGFALFGKATTDGQLLHGRVLDYMTEVGLQKHAVLIVQRPKGYIPFANWGFAGFIGSVTIMNAKGVSVGEMGGRGEGKWNGQPMSFLVRRVAEEADTLSKAIDIFRNTPRTCEYYYVVADGNIPDARGLAATPEKLDVILPGKAHPKLLKPVPDAVLMSAGGRYNALVEKVKARYGHFDVAAAIELMKRPVAMKSNLHDALFRPATGDLWVSIAGDPAAEPKTFRACDQPYVHYNLKKLLNMLPSP